MTSFPKKAVSALRPLGLHASVFVATLVFYATLKNLYHWSDEYRFAAWLWAGEALVHSHHVLSSITGYLTWWLATLLGAEVSAYGALRLFNEIMTASGAVALFDIALYWGVSRRGALLAVLPFVLSNGVVRYGISAYPGSGALGLGLVGINLLVRGRMLAAGIVYGFAIGQHSILSLFIPGLMGAIGMRFRRWRSVLLFAGISGGAAILTQVFFFTLQRMAPLYTLYSYGSMSDQWKEFTLFGNLLTNIKTYMALLTPGIHSGNRILDWALNLPRLAAFALLVDLVRISLKERRRWKALRPWVLGLSASGLTLFVTMIVIYPNSRQYAVMVWTALGALFVVPLVAQERQAACRIAGISAVFLVHSIFGIEGLRQLAQPRCPGLVDRFKPYAVLTPQRPPWPYPATRPTLSQSKLFDVVDIDCEDLKLNPSPKLGTP